MREALQDSLVWTGFVQWMLLIPAIVAVRGTLASRAGPLAGSLVLLGVCALMIGVLFFLPLYAIGDLPLPTGARFDRYQYASVAGMLVSIPLRVWLGRRRKSKA